MQPANPQARRLRHYKRHCKRHYVAHRAMDD